jgi:hypothetical protein
LSKRIFIHIFPVFGKIWLDRNICLYYVNGYLKIIFAAPSPPPPFYPTFLKTNINIGSWAIYRPLILLGRWGGGGGRYGYSTLGTKYIATIKLHWDTNRKALSNIFPPFKKCPIKNLNIKTLKEMAIFLKVDPNFYLQNNCSYGRSLSK